MRSPDSRSPALRAAALGAYLLVPLLSACYVGEQGAHYLGILARAQPLERVLADKAAPPELRALAERATRIRDFATTQLGLRETRNYRKIARVAGDNLAMVVQACAELSFERYLWSYPLVGKLPYKGFFNPDAAEKEAQARRAEGLDVIIRPVDAFSSLGWLPDPLFSFMAAYGEAELAEIIIHELCHATAFARGCDDWNEELATFVGREAAARYIAANEGEEAPDLASLRRARRDEAAFANFLRGTAAELEAVYRAPLSVEEKRARKKAVIAERAALFEQEYEKLFASERFRGFPMDKINNAYLDLYRMYEGEPELYASYLERVCGGDLRAFIADMARLAQRSRTQCGTPSCEPKAAMRASLAALSTGAR